MPISTATDETFITSDQTTIAFTRHAAPLDDARGKPDPGAQRLVLIHSLALDRHVWDGVVALLAPQVELLTYDCRGHGRSERKAGG